MKKIIIFISLICISLCWVHADELKCSFPWEVYQNHQWKYLAVDNNSFYFFTLENIFFPIPDLRYVYVHKSWEWREICENYGWYENLKKLEFWDFSKEWKKYFILKYVILFLFILWNMLLFYLWKKYSHRSIIVKILFIAYQLFLLFLLFIPLYIFVLFLIGTYII